MYRKRLGSFLDDKALDNVGDYVVWFHCCYAFVEAVVAKEIVAMEIVVMELLVMDGCWVVTGVYLVI